MHFARYLLWEKGDLWDLTGKSAVASVDRLEIYTARGNLDCSSGLAFLSAVSKTRLASDIIDWPRNYCQKMPKKRMPLGRNKRERRTTDRPIYRPTIHAVLDSYAAKHRLTMHHPGLISLAHLPSHFPVPLHNTRRCIHAFYCQTHEVTRESL